REFYWRCIHNTFRVGDFWSHIGTLEILGSCHVCNRVTLKKPVVKHPIALECDARGQSFIWNLTK
ncbi:hypothetical protein K438DRAFT_1481183, partial [Mycena galopus ATCC 62051]